MSGSLEDYFLKAPSSVALIETYEFTHPAFTQTHRIVKNDSDGGVFTLEDSSTAALTYGPLHTRRVGATETLSSAIEINLGDHGDILAAEIDAVRAAGRMNEKPTVIYRGYRSDDYTQILEGPFTLQITDTTRNADGAAFKASPRALDSNRTGAIYTIARFPMTRGFL